MGNLEPGGPPHDPAVLPQGHCDALFETMALGVVYQDRDGRIISANPAAQRILGLTLDQMLGRTSMDPRWKTIREDGTPLPGNEHPSMIALRTGKPVHNVLMGVFHPKENAHRWILVDAIPQFKPRTRKPYQVYTTFIDITELKTAQEAIRRTERQLGALWESMTEGVALHKIVRDEDGKAVNYRLINVNPSLRADHRSRGLRGHRQAGHGGVWHLFAPLSGRVCPSGGDGAALSFRDVFSAHGQAFRDFRGTDGR